VSAQSATSATSRGDRDRRGRAGRHGRIDGLSTTPAASTSRRSKAITTKGFEAVVRNNLTGGFIFMREVYTRWMEQHGGAIVNISADMWMGLPGVAHSGAARAGMNSLTESAALRMGGVRRARQQRGARPHRFERLRPLQARAAARHPEYTRRYRRSATARWRRCRPPSPFLPLAGGCLHHRHLHRVDGGGPNARSGWTLQAHTKTAIRSRFPPGLRCPKLLKHGARNPRRWTRTKETP
jgi:citronellol/citronellal dehydrogenase